MAGFVRKRSSIILVLSRETEQKIHIGNDIVITVVRIKGDKVRLGFDAPQTTTILRGKFATEPPPPKHPLP